MPPEPQGVRHAACCKKSDAVSCAQRDGRADVIHVHAERAGGDRLTD